MKTSIIITGSGISSKRTLRSACMTNDCDVIDLPYGSHELVFRSKKDAVNALSAGYQYLREDKEDWDASAGAYQRGSSLSYDAGRARILVN